MDHHLPVTSVKKSYKTNSQLDVSCFVAADEMNKASKINAECIGYWLCSELVVFFKKIINFNGKLL
jgi:hypothetical protein